MNKNEQMGAVPPEARAEEERRSCEGEVVEFHQLLATFEAEHSLEELLAITDLNVKDAPSHPVREPARKALAPIFAKLKKIKKETDITDERYASLEAGYTRISRAVGMINNDKVRH